MSLRVNLPGTDLVVSRLCLGTANYGASIPEETAVRMLDRFIAGGGAFLDTARVYSDWVPGEKQRSEKLLGRWLRGRADRERIVVATKGGHPDLASMKVPRLSRAEIEGDVGESLRHLGLECLPLYWLHRDDPARPVEELLESMWRLVDTGKVRWFGFSNWTLARAEAARQAAERAGRTGFVASQPLWSLARADAARVAADQQQMDEAFHAWHVRHQVAVVPYASQGGGTFQKLCATPPGQPSRMFDTDENRRRAERVRALCAQTGLNVTAVVLRYLLGQPCPVVPVVGPRNEEQLRDTMAGAAGALTPEQIRFLMDGTAAC
jgi:aryl-alcohol dehydrogenase-like predicted oxidoreductase